MSIDPLSAFSVVAKYSLSYLYKKVRQKRIKRLGGTKEDDIIIVLEVGRSIIDDVIEQLGDVDYVISAIREIEVHEFPRLAAETYIAVKTANKTNKGKRIILVLSGPVVLSAILGQYLGLSHYNICFAYWNKGRYVLVPQANRSLLK